MEDNRNQQQDDLNTQSSQRHQDSDQQQQNDSGTDGKAGAAATMAGADEATKRAGSSLTNKGAVTGTDLDGQVAN